MSAIPTVRIDVPDTLGHLKTLRERALASDSVSELTQLASSAQATADQVRATKTSDQGALDALWAGRNDFKAAVRAKSKTEGGPLPHPLKTRAAVKQWKQSELWPARAAAKESSDALDAAQTDANAIHGRLLRLQFDQAWQDPTVEKVTDNVATHTPLFEASLVAAKHGLHVGDTVAGWYHSSKSVYPMGGAIVHGPGSGVPNQIALEGPKAQVAAAKSELARMSKSFTDQEGGDVTWPFTDARERLFQAYSDIYPERALTSWGAPVST